MSLDDQTRRPHAGSPTPSASLPACRQGLRLEVDEAWTPCGRPRSRWSDLGFQDLRDDEAFVIRLYRCWQHNVPTPYVVEHPLGGLLRHDRLHALINRLLALFKAFGRDPAMESPLLATPLLTWREETLLAMLTPDPLTIGADCDDLARLCFEALLDHGAEIRVPQEMSRSGRDTVELAIARQLGSGW